MKNYITKSELDKTKTYDSYVDVAVKTENGNARFMEKLPAKKTDMISVVNMMSERKDGKVINIEVLKTTYSLKAKWNN
jgi:hypothetical protein